jgi:hypothetical protein
MPPNLSNCQLQRTLMICVCFTQLEAARYVKKLLRRICIVHLCSIEYNAFTFFEKINSSKFEPTNGYKLKHIFKN